MLFSCFSPQIDDLVKFQYIVLISDTIIPSLVLKVTIVTEHKLIKALAGANIVELFNCFSCISPNRVF